MRTFLLRAFRGQFLVEALVRMRSLVILPIATRELGLAGYGSLAFAAALTGLVGTVATFGMPAAVSRFLPGKETDENRAEVFWPAFSAAFTTVVLVAAVTTAAFVGLGLTPHGIPVVLIALACANVVTNESKLLLYSFWRFTLDLKPYYRFLAADVVLLGLAQLFVLLVLHAGPVGMVGSIVIVDLLVGATAFALVSRRLPWRVPTWTVLGPLYRFGLPLGATGLLMWGNNTADRFFVQAYRGSAAVGVYSVGYNLGFLAVSLVATPLFAVLSSVLFRAWDRGDIGDAELLLQRCTTILVMGSLPLILSLGFFGRPFIDALAGAGFSAAHRYVVPVAVGYLLMFLGDLFGYPLWFHKRQYLYSVSMIFSVAVNILGNLLLVPRYGAMGSAVATTASLGALAVELVVINYRFGYARPLIVSPAVIAATAVAVWMIVGFAWPSSPTFLDTVLYSAVATVFFVVAAIALRLVPLPHGFRLGRRRMRT
jgi:O-antigen/teichoic acid export membrane protein